MKGVDLSAPSGKQKQTPLMTATMNWNVRIVDYLMERGADPFIKDTYGFTAKDKASFKQYKTLLSMLSAYEN